MRVLQRCGFFQLTDTKKTVYTEKGAVKPLLEGKTVDVKGIGNSMTPILKSHQVVTVSPVDVSTIKKGDIVLCKVKGNVYMHKVTGIRKRKKDTSFQISNNHGYVNGWTTKIYGKVIL